MEKGNGRSPMQLDEALDELADELGRLQKETGDLVRNYPISEIADMQKGTPRKGALANEAIARRKFARMREIEAILNTHHGN